MMNEQTTNEPDSKTKFFEITEELNQALKDYLDGKDNLLKVWQEWLNRIDDDLKAAE